MGLFKTLQYDGSQNIDWDMTPEYTFGTFESWGGKERIRSSNERHYYFFIDAWGDVPKLCLMERGIKHARVIAEIKAPGDMVKNCVKEQGKVALFEQSHPINDSLKDWLIKHVLDSDDGSMVIPFPEDQEVDVEEVSGLPDRSQVTSMPERIVLPVGQQELSEESVVELVKQYNFVDTGRNPTGSFTNVLVDNGDGLTVTDLVTGLMWQRTGLDIMSLRGMKKGIVAVNEAKFAGYSDWRLPSMAEALSLLDQEKNAKGLYVNSCFSVQQPFVFVDAIRKPGGYWFVDFKQGTAFWSSGTIPGGFGRLCRKL